MLEFKDLIAKQQTAVAYFNKICLLFNTVKRFRVLAYALMLKSQFVSTLFGLDGNLLLF